MEAAPTWRLNGLTRQPKGGTCEPSRRAATTGGAGAACWARKRLRSSSQEATETAGRWSSHMRGASARAMGSQLAMAPSSPLASRMAASYASRKARGSVVPL